MTECTEKIEEKEEQINTLVKSVEDIRGTISQLDKSINEAGSSTVTLRENLRIKRLGSQVVKLKEEIELHDIEEASKLRRNYEEQYPIEKAKETEMQTKVRSALLFVIFNC